jgi:hypothetical protein
MGKQIGERSCAHAEELVLQTARLRPVPWEQALEAWLRRLAGQVVFWWLSGPRLSVPRSRARAPDRRGVGKVFER